jgi:hypothetical protein
MVYNSTSSWEDRTSSSSLQNLSSSFLYSRYKFILKPLSFCVLIDWFPLNCNLIYAWVLS